MDKPFVNMDAQTSVLFESNSPYFSSNKAVFTILFSSTQILVVNSIACQILSYSSDELCSMKLENLLHDSCRNKWSHLKQNFLHDSTYIPCSSEKLVELISKDNEILVVSLYLKKLDSHHKCLVVAEPIERRGGLISTDLEGKILAFDEDVAHLFQYDAAELIGNNIQCLLPSLQLRCHKEMNIKSPHKKYLTGRSKNRDSFAVHLIINWCKSNFEVYQILLWTYPSISGLLLLNEKLILKNSTHYFVKLLFGHSKKEILNKSILNLIPYFYKDIKFQVEGMEQWHGEVSGSKDESHCAYRNNEQSFFISDIVDESQASKIDPGTDFVTLPSNNNVLSMEQSDCFKADLENPKLTLLFSRNGKEKEENITNSLNEKYADANDPITGQDLEFSNRKNDAVDINIFSEYFPVSGVKFVGFGKHKDDTFIDIKYQVKKVVLSDEVYYCVWVSPNFTEVRQEASISRTSSIHSTSIDSFFTKDNAFGEPNTRPGNFSLISECDEVLTTGDYSQNYTNVMEIGKGGFGYVKMAYRNSDGLLVVTKFIKKQKVNVSSWVNHLDLNIKIPLEISFLITLQHPNIVKVLDVFHNDFFVQLVMEKHGAGFDLFEFIDRRPNCDEKLKCYIFRQIVSAVHYLDSLGILHRDIKDENVIINEKFEVKLIDFGSAAFMPRDECFSKFYGTVEYCSPEVLQGNSYRGPELEIWALGVTLYILTFGENPFYDVEDTIKGQFSIPSPISDELNELLHMMLDKNVETRITIEKLIENDWINQFVCIEDYKFEEVVNCSENEAHPPKYINEMQLKEDSSNVDFIKDTTVRNVGFSNSNNSLQSRDFDVPGDFEEKLADTFNCSAVKSVTQRKEISPGALVSSTPLKKRNFRLCKSAVGMRKPVCNFSQLNDARESCSVSWCKNPSELNMSKLRNFNKSSPSLLEPVNNLKKESVIAWEETDSPLHTRVEKCVIAETDHSDANEFSK